MENGPKTSGVDKMMAMREVGGLERSWGGRIGRVERLFGLDRGCEREGGVQVTPRSHEGVADRKSLFVGEYHEFRCQGGGFKGEKSGKSLVIEAVSVDETA